MLDLVKLQIMLEIEMNCKGETDRIRIPKLYFSTPDSGSTLVQLGVQVNMMILLKLNENYNWILLQFAYDFYCKEVVNIVCIYLLHI